MKAIKAVVIIMGVLILAGMVALVYGMTRQFDRMGATGKADVLGALSSPLPQDWQTRHLAVGDGRIVLEAQGPDGRAALFLYDLDSGKPLGRIDLTP